MTYAYYIYIPHLYLRMGAAMSTRKSARTETLYVYMYIYIYIYICTWKPAVEEPAALDSQSAGSSSSPSPGLSAGAPEPDGEVVV